MSELFPDKSRKMLQNKFVDGGVADNQHQVLLPTNTTENLANISNRQASIAYDSTLQEVVFNDGTGFSPISAGSSGADVNLSNLSAPTAVGVDILPADDQTENLGGPGHNWAQVHTQNLISEGDLTVTASGDLNLEPDTVVAIIPQNGGSSAAELRLFNATADQYIGLRVPDAMGSTTTFILPDGDGGAGQVLTTDGSGNLSWTVTPAGPYIVQYATDTDIDISNPPATIDGGTPFNGAPILLINESSHAFNGVYIYQGVGVPMSRDPNFAQANQWKPGQQFATDQFDGQKYGHTVLTFLDGISSIDVDNINFALTGWFDSGAPGDLNPAINHNQSLGTSSKHWQNLYLDNIKSQIKVQDGSEGTTGNVLTSIDTNGTVSWQSPLQLIVSSPSIPGSATQTLTATGLLTSDTIFAVTQEVAGANAFPMIAYSIPADNQITVVWTNDPDAGAVVRIVFKR